MQKGSEAFSRFPRSGECTEISQTIEYRLSSQSLGSSVQVVSVGQKEPAMLLGMFERNKSVSSTRLGGSNTDC